MNLIQQTKAIYNAVKIGYDLPMIVKALNNEQALRQLNEALYQAHGKGHLVVPNFEKEKSSKSFVTNDDIYSIINYIITTASTIPWRVMVRQKDGPSKPENGPLQYLLDNPNPQQGLPQIIEALLGYKLLTGDTFLWAPRLESGVNKGRATEMYVLPANLTKIRFGDPMNPVAGYKVGWQNYAKDDFKPEDVMHSKYFNPDVDNFGDMYGLSPLRAAAKRLAISNEITTAQGNSFKNMGPPGMIARDGEEFTQEQSANLEQRFRNKFMGTRNAGAIPMTGGTVKWVSMGLSPVDLNILQSEKLTFEKLCNIYKFPARVLNNGGEGSTYNNQREDKIKLYTDCIIPELISLLGDFNRWLPMAYDQTGNTYVELDISGVEVLKQDRKAQAEYVNAAWCIPFDRKQEILGEPVDEKWKGVYFIPNNLVPVRDLSDLQPDTSIDDAMKALNHKEYNE